MSQRANPAHALLATSLLCMSTWTAVGCGGASGASRGVAATASPGAPRTGELEALVSPDALAMARIDVRELLASAPFVHLEERVRALVEETDHRADFAFDRDLAHRTEELVMGLTARPDGSGSDMVLLLRGRFAPTDVDRLGEHMQTSVYEGHAFRGEESWGFAWIADGILAVGPTRLLQDTCDHFDGRRPSGPPVGRQLARALARADYGRHAVTYAVRVTDDDAREGGPAEGVETFDGYCDMTDRLHCELDANLSDASGVEPLRAQWQRAIDALDASADETQTPASVRAMLAGITFRAAETRLTASVNVPDSVAQDVLEQVVLGVVTAASSGVVGVEAPPPPPSIEQAVVPSEP